MFVHKYLADNDTFYRISSDPNPEKAVVIKGKPSKTRSHNSIGNIMKRLHDAMKEPEPKEEEKKKDEKKADGQEPIYFSQSNTISIADKLRADAYKLMENK